MGGLRVCDPGFCAVTFEHGCVCPPGEGWEVGVGGARIMHVHVSTLLGSRSLAVTLALQLKT